MQYENRRVLVIDDEPSMHEDFRSVLTESAPADSQIRFEQLESSLFGNGPRAQRLGFEVSSGHQGEQGFELAREALARGMPFAVAFVDMRMPPGWDGVQTVKALWRLDPRLQVIFCTAYSDYSWQDTLDELDARDRLLVVKKPFDPIEVWQAAVTLCAKWALERRLEAA
ncbi:response regulator [Ramlibacter sp.]|uniref:response regulator n=1 Tax=Ramlibacter sp. TaxID=1917967 RepID=UPI003D0B59AC